MFFSVPPAAQPVLHIGEYYTEAMPGLAFFTSAKDSLLMRIFWFDSKNKGYGNYKDFAAAQPGIGPSSPDDSYHELQWTVDDKRVTFEWARTATGAAIRLSATGPVKLTTWLAKAWPGSSPTIALNENSYGLQFGGTRLNLVTNGTLKRPIGDSDAPGKTDWGQKTSIAPISFQVEPGSPGLMLIGDKTGDLTEASPILDKASSAYAKGRTSATGDYGDFLAPIQNEMGHSRVFSCETGRISDIVSRNWCLPDGQVLFCWDSFFNGVLASIENPAAGREVVRAILGAQQSNGLVPNFFGRGWGVSADRSQPPVGALCVWKMYQRDPDKAFLREVFPKLLKWHRWWFTARDGNKDGLLEWGSETGGLQNAKFESGLDDSPMFDTGTMSGPHMTLDSVDLNALYAMDAEYLAKIADIIGQPQDAEVLRAEQKVMADRINKLLWDADRGCYFYRYWTPRQARVAVSLPGLVNTADGPGFKGEYFSGQNFDKLVATRQDSDIRFDWTGKAPLDALTRNNYSVRWTANLAPKTSSPYIFKTYADDGVRVWLDDKLIIDDWKVHGTNETDADAIQLNAGQNYTLKVEYFQAEGDANCRLEVEQVRTDQPAEVFYGRYSPLSLYPMMAGVPDAGRADQLRDILFRSPKFNGDYFCPTIARDDPAFPLQGYWRGTIWGPTNYLLWQGVRRYATPAERSEYARKSVALFMKNWNADGTCHENFNGITGEGRSDPHYSWGALLCLIGLEDLCDIEPDGKLRLNGISGVTVSIKNFRLGGKVYDLEVTPTDAKLLRNGAVLHEAKGEAAEF
jgi:hypothetical protein